MMVKKAAIGLAALGLALSACSSGDDEGSAFDEAASASPNTPAATPAADTPEPTEPSPTETADDTPTPSPPTFDTDWNPTLFPDDPDGPAYLTDTIELTVGDPILLPFDQTTVYTQDGGAQLGQGDGVGTECLRSQPSDPFTQEIANEAAENGPYRQGLMFFARCPGDVRLVLLNSDDAQGPEGVAHQYTITITE